MNISLSLSSDLKVLSGFNICTNGMLILDGILPKSKATSSLVSMIFIALGPLVSEATRLKFDILTMSS